MTDSRTTNIAYPLIGVSGMGLGVFWAVWGVHGFFWALLYGFFWPVWFGYRAALYLLAQSLGPIVGGLT